MNRYSQQEREFIVIISKWARSADIALALNRRADSVRHFMRRAGIPGRLPGRRPMAPEAVRHAWRRFQAGQGVNSDLIYWVSDKCGKGRIWTPGDDELLKERVGRFAAAQMARELGRSELAVRRRLRELNLAREQTRYSTRELARLLRLAARTVARWRRLKLVRCYREGQRICIHGEDAAWLLARYWPDSWWGKDIPKHPGQRKDEY
jgi:hypothetical protein